MTLNGHFALKSVLGSACHGFTCSGFRTKLFGNLQSLHMLLAGKCSPETPASGELSFMLSHLDFTELYKVNNIRRISKSMLLFKVTITCLMWEVGKR